MSLSADEEELLALLEAEEADYARGEKSTRAQDTARTEVGAEEANEPTREEKNAAFGQGLAESASFGQAGRVKGAGWKGALGGALGTIAGGPLWGTLGGTYLAAGDDIEKGHEEHQANIEAASAGRHGDEFSKGHLTGDLANAVVGTAGVVSGAGGGSRLMDTLPDAARTAGLRLKGVGKELFAEGIEKGAAPTTRGAVARALKALIGHGGEVGDDAIVASEKVAAERPSWFTGLLDDTAAGADDAASGLELVKRPPPIPKPKPRAPKAPKAEPAAPEPDVRTAAVARLADDAAPARITVDDVGSEGAKATAKLSPAELAKQMGTRVPPPVNPPGAAPAPMAPAPVNAASSTASIKAEVLAAVERGEPLKQLAKRLKMNQGDLNAFYKAAQLGNL